MPIEEKPILKMGKGVYTATELEAGDNPRVVIKSPAKGMAPWKWDSWSDRRVIRPFLAEEPLSSGDLE